MAYRLAIKREAAKYLANLDKPTRARIENALDKLTSEPPEGNIRPMEGLDKWFRLRVGQFRVVVTIDNAERVIYVSVIGPRGDVYKK